MVAYLYSKFIRRLASRAEVAQKMSSPYFRKGRVGVKSELWTYGESNPDLFHAMEPFYRYTIGPSM